MIPRRLLLACLLLLVATRSPGAETAPTATPPAQPAAEPTPRRSRELLKARLAEEEKQKSAAPAANAGPQAPAASAATPATPAPAVGNPIVTRAPADDPKAKAKQEPATVLPKVEVRKRRITELDQQLAKQEQEIAREKKNTKPSEVDRALNDSKIAKPLSIFGGESAQFRQRVASGRVSLMEDEKDILEAMALAKTKEEKAELQKQLDALRAERRELEKALR